MPPAGVNRVDVIIVGKANDDFTATGTVSLVRTPNNKVILVDAGDPWNGDELISKLAQLGVQNTDITDVIITHGHIDHCANLSRVVGPDTIVYMDADRSWRNVYTSTRAELEESHIDLDGNGVKLRSFRGHTFRDLVVVVENESRGGTITIAGDLFEDADDEGNWQALSQFPEAQQESRTAIRNISDWIVPGHGDIFKVNKN